MSRRYTVICHRCGKSTFVDLSKTISDQRCRSCRGFLQGVDVSIGNTPTLHRKHVWRRPGSAGQEPVWQDQEAPVVPVRQRWPRYYRWIIWGGFAGFLVGIGFATYYKFRDSHSTHRELLGQMEAPKVDVRLTEPWRLRATAVARKALEAQTVDELLPLLFHPEAGDDVVRRYYETEERLPLGKDLGEEYFIPPGNSPENVVSFSFTDSSGRPRDFVVVEKPGGMLIDWPSLVGLGELLIKSFIEQMPAEQVVLRAKARLGHYYNNHFNDSTKWLSIRLSDVTDEHVIHGYVDRRLPIAAAMENYFADPEANRYKPDDPVTVVVKHPAGNTNADQTQILELVSTTWYYPDGLKALIEQLRKQEAGISADSGGKEKAAPPDKEAPPAPPAAGK